MAGFVRSLPKQLVSALTRLAADEQGTNWWKEILRNSDLHLAIRENYLNVYARGQSVFKIELSTEKQDRSRYPVMRTHYKYLLRPKMPSDKEYVTFDGEQFMVKGRLIDPSSLIQIRYRPNETISQLVRTAIGYSNAEKSGIHIIVKGNSNVVDMEIGFSKAREPKDPAMPDETYDDKYGRVKSIARRIDLAALHEDGADKARLVFYEVKRFDDGRLWGSRPAVLNQLNKYDTFLNDNELTLKAAYENVCVVLLELNQSNISRSVSDVAEKRRELVIDKTCRLVVFGFDNDQQKGRLDQLKRESGLASRMITRGSPKGLKLS
jgi:hypothetical protein